MEVLSLTSSDVRLLAARFAEHDNSPRRMAVALREAKSGEAVGRLRALRTLERRFDVDLGSLCHRFLHRYDAGTHPLEAKVLEYVAAWGAAPALPGVDTAADPETGAARVLWVQLDRLRAVREWMEEGKMAAEPEA